MSRATRSLSQAAADVVSRMRDLFGMAREAEATLEDPGLQRAMVDVRTAAIESFRNSAPGESAVRENAYWMLRALDGIEDALANRVAEYQFAKEQEARQETSTRQSRRLVPTGDDT